MGIEEERGKGGEKGGGGREGGRDGARVEEEGVGSLS